jgi:hypothetical protein
MFCLYTHYYGSSSTLDTNTIYWFSREKSIVLFDYDTYCSILRNHLILNFNPEEVNQKKQWKI